MELVKLENNEYYFVGEQVGRALVKGTILEYKGEIMTFEGHDNIDSIWKDAVEKGRYVFASTDKSIKVPLVDMNQVYDVWNNRSFTLADMRKCFDEAREKITHPDWDYIHDDFEHFMKNFNNESEWNFSLEMHMTASKHGDLPHTGIKMDEKGYARVTKIINKSIYKK